MHCDILALQEVRFNGEALHLELAPFLGEWHMARRAPEDAGRGGIEMLVRRAAFAPRAEAHIEVLHCGRALAGRMQKGEAWITMVSIHHYGMSVTELKALSRRIRGGGLPAKPSAIRPSSWRSSRATSTLALLTRRHGALQVAVARVAPARCHSAASPRR